jgi:hypothetical protein
MRQFLKNYFICICYNVPKYNFSEVDVHLSSAIVKDNWMLPFQSRHIFTCHLQSIFCMLKELSVVICNITLRSTTVYIVYWLVHIFNYHFYCFSDFERETRRWWLLGYIIFAQTSISLHENKVLLSEQCSFILPVYYVLKKKGEENMGVWCILLH